MRAGIALLPLVAMAAVSVGCPGSVQFSELEKFGPVRSAVWLDLTIDDRDGRHTSHVLVLNSEPGLCDAYQTALPELVAFNERIWDLFWLEYYYSVYYYPDYTEWHQTCVDYWQFMADSFEAFHGPGANAVSLYLTEVENSGEVERNVAPWDGVWEAMPALDVWHSGR